jgi:hypothetical protein
MLLLLDEAVPLLNNRVQLGVDQKNAGGDAVQKGFTN